MVEVVQNQSAPRPTPAGTHVIVSLLISAICMACAATAGLLPAVYCAAGLVSGVSVAIAIGHFWRQT